MKTKYLRVGDRCPTDGCGRQLAAATPSGGYLECSAGHAHATRMPCQEPNCRRLATSFQWRSGVGRSAFCAEHDPWPFSRSKEVVCPD
jgi:hypothetical protein